MISALALLWAALLLAVATIATLRARRHASRDVPALEPVPRVRLVRPNAGEPPWLDEAGLSILEAQRSFPLEVCLTVGDTGQSTLPALQRLAERLSAAGVTTQTRVAPRIGPNDKVSQLAAATADLEAVDVVIIADADVDLGGVDLDRLVATADAADVAAAWAPVPERGGPGWGDRASAAFLGASLHAFPLLSGIDPSGLVGKLFAIRVPVLQRLGGFSSVVDHLGEDMELARRASEVGLQVRPTPVGAWSRATGRHFGQTVRRYARWMTVIRTQRPGRLWAYPVLFGGTAPVLLLAALGATASPVVALFAAGLATAARVLTALAARTLSGPGRPRGPLLLLIALADVVVWAAFARALLTRRVSWGGQWLRVGRAGVMHADG